VTGLQRGFFLHGRSESFTWKEVRTALLPMVIPVVLVIITAIAIKEVMS